MFASNSSVPLPFLCPSAAPIAFWRMDGVSLWFLHHKCKLFESTLRKTEQFLFFFFLFSLSLFFFLFLHDAILSPQIFSLEMYLFIGGYGRQITAGWEGNQMLHGLPMLSHQILLCLPNHRRSRNCGPLQCRNSYHLSNITKRKNKACNFLKNGNLNICSLMLYTDMAQIDLTEFPQMTYSDSGMSRRK